MDKQALKSGVNDWPDGELNTGYIVFANEEVRWYLVATITDKSR